MLLMKKNLMFLIISINFTSGNAIEECDQSIYEKIMRGLYEHCRTNEGISGKPYYSLVKNGAEEHICACYCKRD